jgi:large subunit ribosomal protein L4
VHVVESFVSGDKPSTKSAIATLTALAGDQARPRRSLVVLERGDDLTWLSLRNVDSVHILAVDQLNTYDVLLCDDVVFTKGAYDAFVAGPSTGKSVKAVATSTEAAPVKGAAEDKADQADDKVGVVAPDEYPNSAAPLDNGDAPAGYEIKGNKNSMKYHAPGGRWYDNTVAEVWFKTAADAEAAGFVEAGTKAAAATEEGDK